MREQIAVVTLGDIARLRVAPRGGGPYFLNTPTTLDEGIAFAETTRRDCRRGFVRFEIHDVRDNRVVWRSEAQS
jgi:hypothetical protein